VEGLRVGTRIEVLFERRTIRSAAGSFTDSFTPYQHHVYRLPAGVPAPASAGR